MARCAAARQGKLFLRARVHCREAATCRCTWEATYYTSNFGLHVNTLVFVPHGEHDHSGRLFSQAALKIANSFVESALKAFLLQHGKSESTLPKDSQNERVDSQNVKEKSKDEYNQTLYWWNPFGKWIQFKGNYMTLWCSPMTLGFRLSWCLYTKMKILKRERGIVSCQLLTGGQRQNTTFHRRGRKGPRGILKRIQGKAFTTHGKSTENHEDPR